MRPFAFAAPFPYRAPAFLLGVALLLLPGLAQAQYSYALSRPKAVGVAIWAGYSETHIGAAPDSAPPETKGLIDVLPSKIIGRGGSVAVNYGDWGVNFAVTYLSASINKKADIQQDGNPANDPTVKDMQGENFAINFLYSPIRHLYVGYGRDFGTFSFEIINPIDGSSSDNKMTYAKNFYVLGAAFGFDPDVPKTAPFFNFYGKFPAERSAANGVTYGVGAGVYF